MPDNKTITDEDLWGRVQAGEEHAFRQLFDRYYPYLLVTVTNVTGDRNLAKDAAQEVFFQLWKKREELDINSAFKPYIRRAVLNRAFNVLKSQSKFNSEEDIPEQGHSHDSPQTALETSDLQVVIDKAIDELPERCRMVFTLCRLEGFSHKEVAEQMDISTKTVEHQMTKALKLLKNAVAPYLSIVLFFTLFYFFSN